MSREPGRGIKRNLVSKKKGGEEKVERKETGVKTEHEFLRLAPFFLFLFNNINLGSWHTKKQVSSWHPRKCHYSLFSSIPLRLTHS